jgi:putative flippase GtrA
VAEFLIALPFFCLMKLSCFMSSFKVAVLIPCYNEAVAIAKVVQDFRRVLPDAPIYVFDNNSCDATVAEALKAGAIVRQEHQQGKGHVVRRMFRDIDADFYIMVDGDDTYDADIAPNMLQLAMAGPYDLVNCVRCATEQQAYRDGHRWGNRLLTGVVRAIFGNRVLDMLSGYKVFSKRFVKSFPALSAGFDIETELSVHTLELAMPVAHIKGDYRGRQQGSVSKLRTYRDGWRILMMIMRLIRHERPLAFFGGLAAGFALSALLLMWPVFTTFLETGLVPRFPTAILSVGIMLLGALSLVTGLILDTVSRGRKETRMLAYLHYPAPPFRADADIDHDAVLFDAQWETQNRSAGVAKQAGAFALVGVLGYLVNAGLVELLVGDWGAVWAQVVAFPVAVTVTWWLNRRYTFASDNPKRTREWLRYVAANSLGWLINNGAYLWMVWHMPLAAQHPSLAVAVGSLLGMVFNFSGSRWLVFKAV